MDKTFKPLYRNGVCLNGCLPLTAKQHEFQKACVESAVSLPEYAWREKSDMPIVKWDAAFDKWLDRRIKLADAYAAKGKCLLPWEIMKVIPNERKRSNILNWNQGMRPSCSNHGQSHAFQNATLISMALGSPLYYEAMNPIYSFYLARGGNLTGGLDLVTTATWCNKNGMYPVSLVGDDNQNVASGFHKYDEDAKKWQSGIVFIEDNVEEKIVRACHGLCAVNFGAGHLYTSSSIDSNGIKVMDGLTSGGHAQSLVGYRKVNNEEYIWNDNSHGNGYGQSKEGEPKWGAWLGHKQRAAYCSDMLSFGNPCIVFVEGEYDSDAKFYNEFELPDFPANWIG